MAHPAAFVVDWVLSDDNLHFDAARPTVQEPRRGGHAWPKTDAREFPIALAPSNHRFSWATSLKVEASRPFIPRTVSPWRSG